LRKNGETCIEVTAAANALFLNSFEQWVAAGVTCSEKGTTIKERAIKIRDSYKKAIKANIEYHIEMAKSSRDKDTVALHAAMAEGYKALVR
jgi:hypothetical protein